MKIKMQSDMIKKILNVNLYESVYSDWCAESWEEIYPDVLENAKYVLEDIFNDVGLDVKLSDFTIWNPSEFNQFGTSVDFILEGDEFELKKKIGEEIQKDKVTSIDGSPNMNNFIVWLRETYPIDYKLYYTIEDTIMKFKKLFDYKPTYFYDPKTKLDDVIYYYIEWVLQDCGNEYQYRYDEYMHNSEVFYKYLDREE